MKPRAISRRIRFPRAWRRRLCSAAAFNLVELSIATGIVAVGMVAVLGLLSSGVTGARTVSDDTIVTTLVDDIFDWARITPYGYRFGGAPFIPLPVGSYLTNSLPVTNTYVVFLDANGMSVVETMIINGTITNTVTQTAVTEYGFANNFAPGTRNQYFKFTITPTTNTPFAAPTDITRLMVVAQWPVLFTIANGSPSVYVQSNCSTRVFIGEITRR